MTCSCTKTSLRVSAFHSTLSSNAMSIPLPGSSLSLLAATNTTVPLLATTTLASPLLSASSKCLLATSPPSQSTILREHMVVLVVLLVVLLVVICLLLIYCKIRRSKRRRLPRSASPSIPLSSAQCNFSLDEVHTFTDGFSEANLLGEGGFGRVYRGVLATGRAVAVKRLRVGGGQGEHEFLTEVDIMSRVHHKHVVSLVGYCRTASECILVYELVPNDTLKLHLHEGQPTLDWPSRLKIALGSAKGVAYLHEDCRPKIIHGDIKAANILLDSEFEAKIADFGLSKCISESKSHVFSMVKGTFGYLDPDYCLTGKLTEKADIYSFGVVLLELITGHKPAGSADNPTDVGLVAWAWPMLTKYLEDGKFDSLVDPRLWNSYDVNEMARMVACTAACVCPSAKHRPKMSKIVRALEGDLPLSVLNNGIRPQLGILRRRYTSSYCGTIQGLGKSIKMPLASQGYGRSRYSEPTSGPSSEGPCHPTIGDVEMGRMGRDSRGFSDGS
ncbi:hypothetical protein BT93_C2262 [Corymbia citriodora subsp. variegata]|nr:hypothetical protein BT93_C2262 [Corymbia citriodora subsp. variegata]